MVVLKLPRLAPSALIISICMGESLKDVLSRPLEGAGDGDLVAHSDSYKCSGDPPKTLNFMDIVQP